MPRLVAVADEILVHLAMLVVEIKGQILGHCVEQIGCLLVTPNEVVNNPFWAQKFDISTIVDDAVHEHDEGSDISASRDVAMLEGYEIQEPWFRRVSNYEIGKFQGAVVEGDVQETFAFTFNEADTGLVELCGWADDVVADPLILTPWFGDWESASPGVCCVWTRRW